MISIDQIIAEIVNYEISKFHKMNNAECSAYRQKIAKESTDLGIVNNNFRKTLTEIYEQKDVCDILNEFEKLCKEGKINA